MPGLHITDHQMRMFMSCRHTQETAIAAAKSGFSRATGYRIGDDPRAALAEENADVADGGRTHWPRSGTARLCRS